MRLVIKEYLSRLKEKDELDFLICDLLLVPALYGDGDGFSLLDLQPHDGKHPFGVRLPSIVGNGDLGILIGLDCLDHQAHWPGVQAHGVVDEIIKGYHLCSSSLALQGRGVRLRLLNHNRIIGILQVFCCAF